MLKQQVFKVKGMQRDASLANANGEFAYEIVNMRLMPSEEESGFSLTNEKGTTKLTNCNILGTVIGQCPTNDSLVIFTTNGTEDSQVDRIYELSLENNSWTLQTLFQGNLWFNTTKPIEAIFNYETQDIQKVYWIDSINQLRCINIVESPTNWGMTKSTGATDWTPTESINNQYFDSIKEVNSIPSVGIERVSGGSFTAGVLQYYITYFNEFSSESPIVYTSPLLYIAHSNRGANVNDQVNTAFKLTLTDLDTTNWNYIRVYATHRTSIDATPEGSIISEIDIPSTGTIEFTDSGSNRISITPTDLYFKGGKWVKAGTMTVKDQVMFLGNLNTESDSSLKYTEIKALFDSLRESGDIDNFFSTETRKQRENILSEYEDTNYYYKNQLNNTESITHYKYGEKYRFGISLMDKYGVWSNPIWIKDAFILTPPEQVSEDTLELPCPSLELSKIIEENKTLWDKLQGLGAVAIKPLVVFPKEDERKVIAQGVVCPTVYNLKDRKENGPYAQASWFMRPNVPVDLWGIKSSQFGENNVNLLYDALSESYKLDITNLSHKSDIISTTGSSGLVSSEYAGYYGIASSDILNNNLTAFDYVHDDFMVSPNSEITKPLEWKAGVQLFYYDNAKGVFSIGETLELDSEEQRKVYEKGNWVEFRHNYSLRTKGESFGHASQKQTWNKSKGASKDINWGMVRGAELDASSFFDIPPTNRFKVVGNETVDLSFDEGNLYDSNFYFATSESPKTIKKRVKNGEPCYLSVIYKYAYIKGEEEFYVLHLVDKVKIQKAKTFFETIILTTNLKTGDYSGKFTASTKDTLENIIPDGANFYLWSVGGYYEDPDRMRPILVKAKYPKITVSLTSNEDDLLCYGDTSITNLAVGNSSYYVDNSIITLNSPEIEKSTTSTETLADANFRIIGMIPLTATASDVSLEVDSPNTDLENIGSGLVKRTFSNKNIGYQGFKGIVGSNAYLSSFSSYEGNDTINGYSLTSLHPWQVTGTLGFYANNSDNFGKKDLLKKKILSNLRYSASTYFFEPDSLSFKGNFYSNSDQVYAQDKVIGWKPANGCFISSCGEGSNDDIIKLFNLGYKEGGLVYKGNIDSLAIMSLGDTNTPVDNAIYSFGQYPTDASVNTTDISYRINSPAAGSTQDNVFKTVAASIKYKSSPHYIVGFKCFDSLWGSSQKIQETLPAWTSINEEGLYSLDNKSTAYTHLEHGRLFEDPEISSLYHQEYISTDSASFGLPSKYIPGRYAEYDWNNQYSNNISVGKSNFIPNQHLQIASDFFIWIPSTANSSLLDITVQLSPNTWKISAENQSFQTPEGWGETTYIVGGSGSSVTRSSNISININFPEAAVTRIREFWADSLEDELTFTTSDGITISFSSSYEDKNITEASAEGYLTLQSGSTVNRQCSFSFSFANNEIILNNLTLIREVKTSAVAIPNYGWLWLGEIYRENDPTFGGNNYYNLQQNNWEIAGDSTFTTRVEHIEPEDPTQEEDEECVITELRWTIGDTYYQRFDTLKTYAYDDKAQNSIIDITSFMVETRVNIDGRYDRNRGQESNLQMSPTNFNLMNDIYSQRDNFFTYRILDDDVQARTDFPQQITWSLSKTAGETVDAWMNVTLASVLDLDGTKGKLTALKTFNNNIVAFQESGLSQILFNSRVQIPTSEAVPIQIANSGKVDGQQYFTQDVGCQDKWNIVTTPNGLYFVDYYNKSIYKFSGQVEELTTANGFRGWCNKYINENSRVIGYYDTQSKEVMYFDSNFRTDELSNTSVWLGFSELTNAFSSFYTYPKAILSAVKGNSVWLYGNYAYTHQTGDYNDLLETFNPYGLTVIPRQDSNTFKTFYNVEFRADSYTKNTINNSYTIDDDHTFDTINAETEYQGKQSNTLTYSKYLPSNLKKKFRTWRANIPRVNSTFSHQERFSNQWAKIGLWKKDLNTEKTILHDMAVIYGQ